METKEDKDWKKCRFYVFGENAEKLEEMVIDFKVLESTDTYEELLEKWKVSKKAVEYIKNAQENNIPFDKLREKMCKMYERGILTFLKEII